MLTSQWMVAGAGFLFHFLNSKWQEERKARIERVNAQLKYFYGPLLAAVSASKSAFDALVAQHSPDATVQGFQASVHADPGGAEAEAYRLWVREVLQPLNEQAAAIVRDHIDQLDNAAVVPQLLQLVAHVSTMRVTLQRWAAGDNAASSTIPYPDKLLSVAEREFNRVKTRQAQLLGEQPPKALAPSDRAQLAVVRSVPGGGGSSRGAVALLQPPRSKL